MPVRFSCKHAVIRPSASSDFKNSVFTREKNNTDPKISKGVRHKDATASVGSKKNNTGVTHTNSNSERLISTRLEARNERTVSTSELQRCTRSPVFSLSKKLACVACNRAYKSNRNCSAIDSDARAVNRPRKN